MKEIQFHPVKDNILHIDFFEIVDNKPVGIIELESLNLLKNVIYIEKEELKTQCSWEWINENDFKGCKVTGPNTSQP